MTGSPGSGAGAEPGRVISVNVGVPRPLDRFARQ